LRESLYRLRLVPIGIEHVGSETALMLSQAAASAALIRWLLQEDQIPRTNILRP